MFRYMIDLSQSLTVSEWKTVWRAMQVEALTRVKDDIGEFLDSLNEELEYEFRFSYMYLSSVRDYWLVMAKLHDKQFYKGIVSTEIIIPE